MPVGWAAAGAAVAGAAGAYMSADAAKDAAKTQGDAAMYAADIQREMFDISRAQQLPFMQSGYGANAELSRLMGIVPQTAMGNTPGTNEATEWDQSTGRLIGDTYLPPNVELVSTDGGKDRYYDVMLDGVKIGDVRPGGANGRFRHTGPPIPTPAQLAQQSAPEGGTQSAPGTLPDSGPTGLETGYLTQLFGPEQFKAGMDPGYQWRLQQGAQGVMNTAAAGSGSLSGPALKALMEYNQGAASQEYSNAFNRFQTQQGNIFQRLTSMAGMGQNAAAGVGNQAVATGGNIGANIVGGANAAAAGQVGAANAWSGALSDLGGMGAWWAMNRQQPVK